MKGLCAVVSGGKFSPLDRIGQASFVVACDLGLAYAARCGVRPDLLVGDFDSYRGEIPQDIPRHSLPVEKDDTDTMAAVRWAVAQGFTELALYCALGGRLDHLLGNLQCAAFAAEHGLRVHIYDEQAELLVLSGGEAVLPRREGWSLSLLSLSDRCEGVSIRGTKYQLENTVITNRFPIGVSNEWEQDAHIRVESGVLLICQCRKPAG